MEYSIHRLLSLRKTTEERIRKAINGNQCFVATVKGKSRTINGVPVENVERDIKATYDKVMALISNYRRIKAAILRSNAGVPADTELTRFCVAGKTYTMAELIDASNNIYGNEQHQGGCKARLLVRLKLDYSKAQEKIELQAQKVEQNIKDYFEKAAVGDKQLSAEDMAKRSEMLHEDGDLHLVDPLNIKKVIDDLESEIYRFREECDAVISEQNAVTKVDLSLIDIDF